ncbi:hypothetical protein GCM10010425_74210 [Streptomyces spororaveus]|uniref:Uncharacterized protein n=1 Tax=Streptomyces spororaveus TaxID=284039 RepID=A0ABQ3TQD1_9ACTN|nr:hypothetical protein Sspor_00080 [Streptomyces spororaveus]GHI82634.1 hypothetical protein Sspor_81950 [Streptomyces spororaveus]
MGSGCVGEEASAPADGFRAADAGASLTASASPTGRSQDAAAPNPWTRRLAAEPRTSPPTPPRVLFELDDESGEWLPVGVADNAAEAAAFIHGW